MDFAAAAVAAVAVAVGVAGAAVVAAVEVAVLGLASCLVACQADPLRRASVQFDVSAAQPCCSQPDSPSVAAALEPAIALHIVFAPLVVCFVDFGTTGQIGQETGHQHLD